MEKVTGTHAVTPRYTPHFDATTLILYDIVSHARQLRKRVIVPQFERKCFFRNALEADRD
jgi:hypothetical protein